MVSMAQRIEALRTERNISRPALAAALGLPRMAIEKFETGRQTPTQEQLEKLAAYFAVSSAYLRGETNDRTSMSGWMDAAYDAPEQPAAPVQQRPVSKPAAPTGSQGGMLDALLASAKFQQSLRESILDVLRTPEGQELLAQIVRKELLKQK